jgi:ankyrin repeat protein
MKHLLLTTIAAVLVVGCGLLQQSFTPAESKTAETLANAETPNISIHEAVWTGKINVVKQHLAAGTDVGAKNVIAWTPLHYAAFYGHKEIAELLLNANDTNVNEKNDVFTALDWAVFLDKIETANLIRKHGGKTWKELKAEGK